MIDPKNAALTLENQLAEYYRRFRSPEKNRSVAKLAYIVRVDPERNTMDIIYLSESSGSTSVPISFSFAGLRSFAGGMPEPGSLVVIVYLVSDDGSAFPVPVAYLPRLGKLARNYDVIHDPVTNKNIRAKARKLYPGEWLASSAFGSEVYLDKNVLLSDSAGNEIKIRPSDNSILLRSLNKIVSSAAGLRRSGLVVRNDRIAWFDNGFHSLTKDAILQLAGQDVADLLTLPVDQGGDSSLVQVAGIDPIVLEDGSRSYVITRQDSGGNRWTIDDGGIPWVEDRAEFREFSDVVLDVTEGLDGYDIDFLIKPTELAILQKILNENPQLSVDSTEVDLGSVPVEGVDDSLVVTSRKKKLLQYLDQAQKNALYLTRVFGTVVGNDPLDKAMYGKVLRRRTFKKFGYFDSTDNPRIEAAREGQDTAPKFEVCASQDEERQIAEASQESYDQSHRTGGTLDTVFTVNKEGKLQGTLSSSGPQDKNGEGISAEIVAEGAAKIFLGRVKQLQAGHSFHRLSPLNGVRTGITDSGQSLYLVLDGSLDIDIIRPNSLEDGFSLNVQGNRNDLVKGTFTRRVTEDQVVQVDKLDRVLNKGNVVREIEGSYYERVDGNNGKVIEVENDFTLTARKITFIAKKELSQQFDGDYSLEINGKYIQTVSERKLDVLGKIVETVGAGTQRSVMGAEVLAATGNIDHTATSKITHTAATGFETKVDVGDVLEQIKLGNFNRTIQVQGSFVDQTTLGNFSRTTKVGDISDLSNSGNISRKTDLGSITDDASGSWLVKAMNAEINANSKLTLKASAEAEMYSPSMLFGTVPPGGGSYATKIDIGGFLDSPPPGVKPGTKITIGGSTADEYVILGKTFLQWLFTHTHPTTAPGAPTGPITPAQTILVLPGVHYSSRVFVAKG